MTTQRVNVGLIGCGDVSEEYIANCQRFGLLNLVACADVLPERAMRTAEHYHIPRACEVEELFALQHIEIIINLTPPRAHGVIAARAIQSGKHVYNEKPLAASVTEAGQLLALAGDRNLLVGCAPDTFLGAGLQTARVLLDQNVVGRVVGFTACLATSGHEDWHPNPEIFYQHGAGPLFDMGPYYLTALVFLLGPVKRVTGSATTAAPTRTYLTRSSICRTIDVEVPTHVAGVVEFHCGVIGTIVTTFDTASHACSDLTLYGTQGTLRLPDPNGFGGPLLHCLPSSADWVDVPLTHGCTMGGRGIGVVEMAAALRKGRPHRASGALALHVLDIMQSLLNSARLGRHIEPTSTCSRPEPLLGCCDGGVRIFTA